MTKKRRTRLRVAVPLSSEEGSGEVDPARIVAHFDGFYWVSDDGRHETGPFATFDEAAVDMARAEQGETEVGETLEEARDELGISGWVDPDTNEVAEDERTRLEDH